MSEQEHQSTEELAADAIERMREQALAEAPKRYPVNAREHLDWAITHALEAYEKSGEWTNAWAVFVSDIRLHKVTEWIADDPSIGAAIASGQYNSPEKFRFFLSLYRVDGL